MRHNRLHSGLFSLTSCCLESRSIALVCWIGSRGGGSVFRFCLVLARPLKKCSWWALICTTVCYRHLSGIVKGFRLKLNDQMLYRRLSLPASTLSVSLVGRICGGQQRKLFVLWSLTYSQENSAPHCLEKTELLPCLCKHSTCPQIPAVWVCLSGHVNPRGTVCSCPYKMGGASVFYWFCIEIVMSVEDELSWGKCIGTPQNQRSLLFLLRVTRQLETSGLV